MQQAAVEAAEKKELEADIGFLHQILSEIIAQREGEEFVACVKRIINLSAGYQNERHEKNFAPLVREVTAADANQATELTKAFTAFLSLVTIAEEHHKARRARLEQDFSGSNENDFSSLAAAFKSLLAGGVRAEQLYATTCALRIELVLTAHPTEIMRRSILSKYSNLARLLDERAANRLSPYDRELNENAIRREVFGIWETDPIRKKSRRQPTKHTVVCWFLNRRCGLRFRDFFVNFLIRWSLQQVNPCRSMRPPSALVRGWEVTATATPT